MALKRSRWLTRLSMRSILRKKGSLTKELLDDVMEVIQRPRPWQAFEQFQQDEILPDHLRTVLVDRMGELKMPVLIFHGDRDSLVPMASVQEAVRINPDIRLAGLEGCGHWSQRDCPDEFHQI